MTFQADFETTFGQVRAVWQGGPYIHLYPNDGDAPTAAINVWDYERDEPRIKKTAKDMVIAVRSWLYEMERGIEIISIQVSEISEVDEAW